MSDSDRGSVTTEFALVLPAVVLVLGLALSVVSWGGHQLRASDLASVAARVAAVEGDERARAAVADLDGDASVALERGGAWVSATVSLSPVSWLPTVDARVTARVEP